MPANTKKDYKKLNPELYNPPRQRPTILMVPKMKFFMIDGKGNPNTSHIYKDSVELLYNVSYSLKMKVVKKQNLGNDYVVPPLEGLWYMDDMTKWAMDNKEEWNWTMMIRIPDFVSEEQIKKAIEIIRENKNPPLLPKVRVDEYNEGLCVQIMHMGPYEEEPLTIQKMHTFAEKKGFIKVGKHHEIYLSDPRRTQPERLKTVLRQPLAEREY